MHPLVSVGRVYYKKRNLARGIEPATFDVDTCVNIKMLVRIPLV